MGSRRNALIALALAAATALVFAGVVGNGFVEYDDDLYVSERPEVLAGLDAESWRWAWTSFQGANWFPLTRLSWMLDAELFGANPAAFHATSLALHVVAVLLLFAALLRLTRDAWPAAFAAAIFALHPLHVESVAWVAARKDVLSGVCFVLALWLHERRARGSHPVAWSLALAACLALGLLAKPMLVTLPCVLLLLDYWPLGRLGDDFRFDARRVARAVLEKLPLFALAGAASVVTVLAQREGGALQNLEIYPLGMRVEAALDALLRYLGSVAWPFDLAVFYPHPRGSVPLWRSALGLVVLFGGTLLAWRARRSAPHVLVGWAWFVGMLVPVSGLVQVGQAALADRYTYLPLIGLAVALAWSAKATVVRWPSLTRWTSSVGVLWLIGLALLSAGQVRTWRDGESLFRHALMATQSNAVAHTNLALVLVRDGRDAEAEGHLDTAIELAPGSAIARGLRGELRTLSAPADAALDFRIAARLEPLSARWRTGLARSLADTHPAEAEESLRVALAIDANFAQAHVYLAALLQRAGRDVEAAQHYGLALADAPALAIALGAAGIGRVHGQHAALLQRLGRESEAVDAYEAALERGERSPMLVNNFAWLLATGDAAWRDPARAVVLAQEAVAANRTDAGALDTLATALASAGRETQARAIAERALAQAEATGDVSLATSIRRRFPNAAVSNEKLPSRNR